MKNIEEIKKVLPHREPMLLIDEVEGVIVDDGIEYIVAYKHLTGDEEYFQGHFPEFKVMPGVLILEALAQTGAYHVLSLEENKGKLPFFAGVDKVRWRKKVVPGDTLKLKVRIKTMRNSIGIGEGYAYVNDELVCDAIIKFVIADADAA